MKIGFYMQWPKGSLNGTSNVLGDELWAETMCKALLLFEDVTSVNLYAPNHLPAEKLDVMIYINDTDPIESFARKHVFYMQNAYNEGSDNALKRKHSIGFDGYAFISNRICRLHRELGYHGIFLPFGVDSSIYSPRDPDPLYQYDVAYIGNDIKGKYRSMQYLYPAIKYNFGLFGNWNHYQPKHFWKKWGMPRHLKAFSKISKGRIPQEDVPVLYSSAKINLNCTAQDCVDWDVITLRIVDVLACKGFLITDKVPIAEKLLQNCVVFTDGGKDLTAKIDYYLGKPNERKKISECGYDYVIRHATSNARMKYLLSYLKDIV